jgi:hypothetical protein
MVEWVDPHRPRVEWRGLKGIWGVTEADVTAPTDAGSVGRFFRRGSAAASNHGALYLVMASELREAETSTNRPYRRTS